MKSEFILLPIIAYSSLLFLSYKSLKHAEQNAERRGILFFALLGLLGTFLAKGANDPFGGIYLWIFNHMPGFILFRDPIKWYILIALSYSVLIPFSVWLIYNFLKSKKIFLHNIFLIAVFFYLLFLIRPAIFGNLTGTFNPHSLPDDYKKLEIFLSSKNKFFRTFWFPTTQRYGFHSNNNPAISAQDYLNTSKTSSLLNKLEDPKTEEMLQNLSIRYVIVPYDTKGEIFIDDRKHSENEYKKTIAGVEKIEWLKKVDCSIVKLLNCSGDPFGKIKVFELSNPRDHFWSTSDNMIINYSFINPTEYKVDVQNAKKRDILIFSENFNKNWSARREGMSIVSKSFNGLNSFTLPKDGNYDLEIYYSPQKMVKTGLILSIFTFLSVLGYLIYPHLKRYNIFL